MFSCIIAKRAGFEDLVMSRFATRFKHRQHTENITDDDECPIHLFNYPCSNQRIGDDARQATIVGKGEQIIEI